MEWTQSLIRIRDILSKIYVKKEESVRLVEAVKLFITRAQDIKADGGLS